MLRSSSVGFAEEAVHARQEISAIHRAGIKRILVHTNQLVFHY
jgi:hypothetical protein